MDSIFIRREQFQNKLSDLFNLIKMLSEKLVVFVNIREELYLNFVLVMLFLLTLPLKVEF